MAALVVCSIFVATLRLSLALSHDLFEKIDSLSNREFVSAHPLVLYTQAGTQLECARLCVSQVDCSSFNYATASRWCAISTMSNVTESDTEPADEQAEFYVRESETGPPVDRGPLAFKISDGTVSSWEAAVNACRAENLELVILDTPQRQAVVIEAIRADPALRSSLGTYVYVGAARPVSWWGDLTQPDTYYWLDGTEVVWHDSEYWGVLQPNGYGIEECVAIETSSLTLWDRSVSDTNRYICQY